MYLSVTITTSAQVTTTFTKRMQKGFQAQATYTLARGTDNAPLTGTYVVGSNDDRLSDPTNIGRDKGVKRICVRVCLRGLQLLTVLCAKTELRECSHRRVYVLSAAITTRVVRCLSEILPVGDRADHWSCQCEGVTQTYRSARRQLR